MCCFLFHQFGRKKKKYRGKTNSTSSSKESEKKEVPKEEEEEEDDEEEEEDGDLSKYKLDVRLMIDCKLKKMLDIIKWFY